MIKRVFTEYGKDPYNEVNWKKVDVCITDYSTGEIIYEGHDLEFPDYYSQQACDIIASKYFFRNIDGEGTPETSLKQVIDRMVWFWTKALIDEGILEDFDLEDTEAQAFFDECKYTLLHQMWAPNSPQWFNTGIELAYGIKGDPDDLYYCAHFPWMDEVEDYSLVKSKDRYTRSQTSACFIIPVTDHLIGPDSITDHYVTETKLFKGGSGVGTNFSPVRAAGESLSSGGESSGVMSFLLGLDRNAGAIKSGGTTRRAAKMVILDIDHPDIEEFIEWKAHEELKAQDLISLGYDSTMTGEAYSTVSGQNSNNSVRVSKEFMDKVLGHDPDPMFELKGRTDDKVNKTVNAHDLWKHIAEAAWVCADPGVQFDDRFNDWNPIPKAGRINATNPCSEFAFIDNSACNLASINVEKFVYKSLNQDEDEYLFNIEKFRYVAGLCQLVLEASIYWGQFPTKKVAENSYLYRPTGLGLTNIAAALLEMGYPYDSGLGKNVAAQMCSIMTAQSYITSAWMAKRVGPCEGFKDNRDDFIRIIKKHTDASRSVPVTHELWNRAYVEAVQYGVRNMQTTVLAPTGTISLAMDCASTGIEPFFSHKIYKKCSDGSMMEIVNPFAEKYIEKLNVTDYIKQDSLERLDKYGTVADSELLGSYHKRVLATANEISPLDHVKMMAAVQPFISGSISKTVNLPNTATVEDIQEIYETAYELGCKSISIYRDGSKGTQPLNVSKDDTVDDTETSIIDEENDSKICCNDSKISCTVKIGDEEYEIDKVYKNFEEYEKDFPSKDSGSEVTVDETDSDGTVYVFRGTGPFDNDSKFYAREEYPYHTVVAKDDYLTALDVVVRDDTEILISADTEYIEFKSTMPIEFTKDERNNTDDTDSSAPVYRSIESTNSTNKRIRPNGIRTGRTHNAKIGNVELYITVSYYDDGKLCEIFVSSDKEGTTIKGLLSSLSKSVSHMLQHGIDPHEIAVMLRNQQYEPAGVVERHPYIKMCSSISDLIARVIELECGDYSGCQVKPEERERIKEVMDDVLDDYDEDGEPYWKNYTAYCDDDHDSPQYSDVKYETVSVTGNICPVCHSDKMIQNGSCEVCLECGTTTGCS